MTLGEFFKGLAENRPLVSAVTAWAVAQVLKTIINYLINKEWKAERLWGSGGMPSSHSATVCAFLVATVFNYGPASFEFAMAVLFAIVVIHDARGVRERVPDGWGAAALLDTSLDLVRGGRCAEKEVRGECGLSHAEQSIRNVSIRRLGEANPITLQPRRGAAQAKAPAQTPP